MKRYIAIVAALFSVHAFAATTKAFDVKAEVSINGKLVSSSHMIAKPNASASITQRDKAGQETLFEMVASDYSSADTKDGIMLRFTLSELENGKKTLISKPQIIALPGEAAEISSGSDDGKDETVRVKVIATRIP